MKTRIVERKYADGQVCYVVQFRLWGCLWWLDLEGYIPHMHRYAKASYETLAQARADYPHLLVKYPIERVVPDSEQPCTG